MNSLQDLKKEAREISPHGGMDECGCTQCEEVYENNLDLIDRTWNLAMERAKFIVEQNLGIGGDYDGSEKQKKDTILAKSIITAINKEKV